VTADSLHNDPIAQIGADAVEHVIRILEGPPQQTACGCEPCEAARPTHARERRADAITEVLLAAEYVDSLVDGHGRPKDRSYDMAALANALRALHGKLVVMHEWEAA